MNADIYETADFEIKTDKRGRKYKKNLKTGKTSYKIDDVEPPIPSVKKTKGRPKKIKEVVIENSENENSESEVDDKEIEPIPIPIPKKRKSRAKKVVEIEDTDNSDNSDNSDSDNDIKKQLRGRPKGSKNRTHPIIIKIDNSKKYKKQKPDQIKYKGEIADRKATMTYNKDIDDIEFNTQIAEYIAEKIGMELKDF